MSAKKWILGVAVCGMLGTLAFAAATLPFGVIGDDYKGSPFIASGWMGNTGAIGMDDKCAVNPHSGKTCLKVDYKAADNWGGVVWQNPANDWGDQPGGVDLTGAKKLTIWARGEKGGEKVKFGFGVLGADKKYSDTGKAETEVTLTTEWKAYEIDLAGKDLSRIKTGFMWVVGGQGAPVTFYLDDVVYE